MVSGAAGSRRGDGINAWDVQDAGCRTRSSAHHQESGTHGLLVPPQKALGPAMVHVDNRGITDGLCGGEMKCMGPRAKDADLWDLI